MDKRKLKKFINYIVDNQHGKFKGASNSYFEELIDNFINYQASDETKIINENETLIKDCETCKYGELPSLSLPCRNCNDSFDKWEQSV